MTTLLGRARPGTPDLPASASSSAESTAAGADAADSLTDNGNTSNTATTTTTALAALSPSAQNLDNGSGTLTTVVSTQTPLNGVPTPVSNSQLAIPAGPASDNQSNLPMTPSTSVIPSTASSLFSQSNKSSHDLSPKAVAGIGIGAAAAGAAIALFLAFVIFRCCRRRRNGQHLAHESAMTLTGPESQLFHPAYAPVPVAAPSLEKTDSVEMLSPSTDDSLFASWADLRDRIQSHVDSMYHSSHVEPGTVSLESFERLGYMRAQPSAPELLGRLMQPNYRLNALMYLVSWCIVQRIDFNGSRRTTLLPPECVESLKAMAGGAPAASLNHWRMTTAALLQKTYVENGFTRDDPRTAHIEAALKALMPILNPFVEEGKITTCFEDLEDIFEEAARFGFRLFANPAVHEFDWYENRWFEKGELTPFPELKKIDDSRALEISLA